MNELLKNPWFVSIASGMIVGVLFLLLRSRGKRKRSHVIKVGKSARLHAGGKLVSGDIGKEPHQEKEVREHRIIVDNRGIASACEDILSGDEHTDPNQ